MAGYALRAVNDKCPRCGSVMLQKGSKLVCADENCGFVKDAPKAVEA